MGHEVGDQQANDHNEKRSACRIWVRGIVQGVGFRPFIYNLAEQLRLVGWVKNTSGGVEIEINGSPTELDLFVERLKLAPPPLSRIDDLRVEPCKPNGYEKFEILESQAQTGAYVPISPDVAICPDCRRELFEPTNARYRYPFINCTNCGPRFSLIKDIPYDRSNTTMASFELCPDCREEYENPHNRRFHAQPVACAKCGPHIWFEADGEQLAAREEALQTAREWLTDGKILAVKGLGGFHLACDATDPKAVAELRRRKKRSDKPFALMAYNLETIRKQCEVSEAEADLLTSRQAPIVLLKRKDESTVAEACAPGLKQLGFMLPYTPLHLLLLEPAEGFPEVLVMTSANLSEEPIAYEDEDARQRLGPLADGFLLHDRPIYMRVDELGEQHHGE